MSIELPEAHILATQMNDVLTGKTVASFDLKDVERMIKIGFIKKPSDFDILIGKTISSVRSRGNTIHVKMSEGANLLIAPEYGGIIRFLKKGEKTPKYHLKLEFKDGNQLTTRITSMGVVAPFTDEALNQSYMYKRDFLNGVSPIEPEFTWGNFKTYMQNQNRQLKPLLVGKDAWVVGVSNASFQDILYRAKLHPKRKASQLSEEELHRLYESIKTLISERLEQKGKNQFKDIHGNTGEYTPIMGPNMKNQNCQQCGTPIQRIAHGGGHVYLCPTCQKT